MPYYIVYDWQPVAVGGRETLDGGATKEIMYVYSPSAKVMDLQRGFTCST